MVQYRQKDDWASYTLARIFPFIIPLHNTPLVIMSPQSVRCLQMTAQWQSWLRHSREDTPSLEELLLDIERRQRVRQLAKLADDRWRSLGSGGTAEAVRLGIGSSEGALQGNSLS
jgi:hypothetical protein